MTTLNEIYAKFGEAAEAAQLLETEIGNMLLWARVAEHDLLNVPDKTLARKLFAEVDRKTLGQLIHALQAKAPTPANLEEQLRQALQERNRLNHSFYKQHNFRRNSAEGRALMLQDLARIHEQILDVYKAVMLVNGVDLDGIQAVELPTGHLPI